MVAAPFEIAVEDPCSVITSTTVPVTSDPRTLSSLEVRS